MKYLITGTVEFYQYVEAESEEEALDNPNPHDWRQTLNMPIQNLKARVVEIKTTGSESKDSEPESAPEYK